MSATYPSSVRTFSPKQDDTEFVLAAHVNDLQDEVAAIERTLGAMVQEWDSNGVEQQLFASVKARLDTTQTAILVIQGQIVSINAQLAQIGPLTQRVTNLETTVATINTQITAINNALAQLRAELANDENRITALENNTSGLPGLITSLQNQINALQSGQVAYVRNTGQVVAPDPYQWRVLNWSNAPYDNAGIFLGGSNLICPQDGWWTINMSALMPNTRFGDGSPTECITNLSLRIDGNEVAGDSEQLELGIGGTFRLNVGWAGPWYRGSSVTAAVNFNPWDGSFPAISATISFTRMHNL